MKKVISAILNFLVKFLPIKENKILFQSGRNKVDCSPYAIYRYIKDNKITKYQTMWIVEKGTDTSMLEEGDYCYYHTIKALYHQATSHYWIRSQSIGSILKKRKGQRYIQAWHGAGNFKKSCYDITNERDKGPLPHTLEWDYYIATDEENKKAMISSVDLRVPALVLGNPDSDLMTNATDDYKKEVIKKLGLEKEKRKKILYAPTFRDNEVDNDTLDIHIEKLGELKDYVVLLRFHPIVSGKLEGKKLPDNFINVGSYPNIEDLFLITDILITDYSSIIFPYMILEKKIIFYPYDMEFFTKLRGGFYLDYYNDLPGPIVNTEEELVDCVKNIDKISKKYEKKVKWFNDKYNKLNDGNASKRVMDELEKGTFDK